MFVDDGTAYNLGGAGVPYKDTSRYLSGVVDIGLLAVYSLDPYVSYC